MAKPLTAPMGAMLAEFAAGLTAWNVLHGKRNADRTLAALVARGLVARVPVTLCGKVVDFKVTQSGRDEAWRALVTP